ncbi:hypothetical protein FS837_008341 [Tulasnella sp. UAMH 9824]|nr:hypothetical protein FS837_008341 [Tulasnella sp. UAMH 9824]
MYTLQEIWSASLLLIPIQITHHWLLAAVTNPCQAVSREASREGLHDVIPGELKPDREPFTILLLNSSPQYAASTVSKLPAQLRRFLELTWFKLKSSTLEFVNSYPVKCPEQIDSISCGLHVVHNAEILMREGTAEQVRKAAQSLFTFIFQPTAIRFVAPPPIASNPSPKSASSLEPSFRLERPPVLIPSTARPMEPFQNSSIGSTLSSHLPDDSSSTQNLEAVASCSASLQVPTQPATGADLAPTIGENSAGHAHNADDELAKRRAEKKAMKKALKEKQSLPQQDLLDESDRIKEERKAREAELKQAKRALKEAKKREKQLGKENKKSKKRQRSPSSDGQAGGSQGGAEQATQQVQESDKQREKKSRKDVNFEEFVGGAVEEDGVDRKRKRDDDDSIPPAAMQGPTRQGISLPEGAVKKIKSIHPFPTSSSSNASVDPHPFPIDPAEVAIRHPTVSSSRFTLPTRSQHSPMQEDVTTPAHDDLAQTHLAILERPSPAPPKTYFSPDEHFYSPEEPLYSPDEPLDPLEEPLDPLDEPLDPPDEPLDSHEEHGPPLQLPQAQPGFYATVYYPYRTQPLQVPVGRLTERAREKRYKGLTADQIAKLEEHYESLSKSCPKVFQEAFKHTARGRLDKVAHHWLVPRVKNYYETHSDGRGGLLDRIVRDLVNEFPDLHPNFLQLKDSSMEKEYLSSLRNTISVAASGIKSALGNPNKVEKIDKDVVKLLTGTTAPTRPHDLWANWVLKKAKEEAEERERSGAKNPERLTEKDGEKSLDLLGQWKAFYDGIVKTQGKKYASDHRLKLEQDFRKKKFEDLPLAERKIWEDHASKLERPFHRLDIVASGLPFINHLLKRFAELAGVPMLVLVGAPDPHNPREVIIYHDTYSPAPSNIPDFFNGPDRFGEKTLVPAFRTFVENCLGESADHVAAGGVSLPTVPEPLADVAEPDPDASSMQIEESTPLGVTSRSGVQFVVTPAPADWTVPSREQENAKKEVKNFISESFKKAHNRQRCNFATLTKRLEQYMDLTKLPKTKIVTVLEADGTPSFKEGGYAQIVPPSDPSAMLWYQIKAWYDLLKDPQSQFMWRVEESTVTANVINAPKSVKDSLQSSHLNNRSNDDAQEGNNPPNSENNPPPATSNNAKASSNVPTKSQSAQSKRRANKRSGSDSESEALSSDSSGEESPYSVGSNSSAGEGYNPNPEFVLRSETICLSGRRSAPPKATSRDLPSGLNSTAATATLPVAPSEEGDGDSDDVRTEPRDIVRPVSATQRPNSSVRKSASLLVSPEKSSMELSPPNPSQAPSPYILKPSIEPEATNIPSELEAMLQHIRELSQPVHNTSRVATLPWLDLRSALTCCVRLDILFPARDPLALSLPSRAGISENPPNALKIFWDDLNDPHKPVPLYLAATQLAKSAGTDVVSVAQEVRGVLLNLVDILEGHDLLEDGEFGSDSFVSWTRYLILLARYLKFIQSVEPNERGEAPEALGSLYEKVQDLTVIYLVLRYCVETMISHIKSFPSPSSSPSIANTVSTLGSSWIRMVKRLACPINKLSISEVYGSNWAVAMDPSGQPADIQPFTRLANSSQRWISAIASTTLYDAIIELEKELHSDPDLFNEMSIYEQFTFLTSFFAVHTSEKVRGSDEGWLGVVDKFLEVIDSQKGGGEKHDTELNPKQPPPTLISTAQTDSAVRKRERPRPYNPNSWHPGDIARVIVNGEEQDVAFAVKQKYGGSRSLVMADPTSMKEILSPDGETPLPLPAFSAEAIIARAPHDITALARFKVPGHWDLPNLEFADAMRPELAAYFAQFQQFPDANDDPDELEALGFKPPSHFIKQYHQRLSSEQVADASSINADETVTKQANAAPLVPPQQPLSPSKTNGSDLGLTMHGSSDQCGSDGKAPASGTEGPLEITTADIEGGQAGDRSDERGSNDQNEPVKPVEEGEEEEEVENALVESLPNPKQARNASKAKKAASKKEKGAQEPGPKSSNRAPQPVVSANKAVHKEVSGRTRSSSRLRTADTTTGQGTEAGPSQPARRASLRNKEVSGQPAQVSTGPVTRSKK